MGLNTSLSASQTYKNQCGEVDCILNDMVFEPVAPFRRFAAGVAGVFFSVDSQHWFRLLDTRAIPSLSVGLWFDFQSNNSDDALYVANAGRGLLRLHPIPRENPYGLPPVATPTPTPVPTPTPTPPGSGKDELKNGSFEAGLAGWQASGYVKVVQNMVFEGQWGLQIGQVEGSLDEISQSFNLPCDARRINLNYEWYLVSTNVSPGKTHIEIMVDTPSGSRLLQSLNELDAQSRWQLASYNLTPYACQPVTLRIRARQPADGVTILFLDAVHLLSFNGKFFIHLPRVMLK
jgi:hypothetical protein